jgi:hypothetical protein
MPTRNNGRTRASETSFHDVLELEDSTMEVRICPTSRLTNGFMTMKKKLLQRRWGIDGMILDPRCVASERSADMTRWQR